MRGKTDADAVFGAIYAQAEDDFPRVEMNLINAMGRLAEAEGATEIYRDLRMKLFVDPVAMKRLYASSPVWLQTLMNAWADGLNYYLKTHPDVRPRVIAHVEPWMALTFSEGSISGDIERIDVRWLEAFYGKGPKTSALDMPDHSERGSNGIAIAPSKSTSGRALLLINPHTWTHFRTELQMTSDEGLDAYGAVTWGQFFVYQGFNERVGWMHTTSGVDAIDQYLETVARSGDGWTYKYGAEQRPIASETIAIPYKTATGMAEKTFTVYRTHHGPIVRELDGKWVSIRLMQDPVNALIESFTRTKARDWKTFRKSLELHANSTNNTIYADADGTIAYVQANFIPRRDPQFDWTKPVDGSDPATEWKGALSIDELPVVISPSTGWVYNTNNAPWTAAGPASPKQDAYPRYVDKFGQNPRGVHAIDVLSNKAPFTLDTLVSRVAFDRHMPAFDVLLPHLFAAYQRDPLPALSDPIGLLRAWDRAWSVDSIPTTVAVLWIERLADKFKDDALKASVLVDDYIALRASPEDLLEALQAVIKQLAADFGTWKTPWGEINRIQRLSGDLFETYDDTKPSIPVGFAPARWGSLASIAWQPRAGERPRTKKRYGNTGNSFVAVVEFGPKVRAKAVMAGGANGHPSSPHFNDQATRYATGALREVYFYPNDLQAHIERVYRPGQ